MLLRLGHLPLLQCLEQRLATGLAKVEVGVPRRWSTKLLGCIQRVWSGMLRSGLDGRSRGCIDDAKPLQLLREIWYSLHYHVRSMRVMGLKLIVRCHDI